MTPNKPLDPTSVHCVHINWHSMFNGPWALCDDCGVQHVRAVIRRDGRTIHVEAGAKSIQRALAESTNVPVAAPGSEVLHIARQTDGSLATTMQDAPVIVTGL